MTSTATSPAETRLDRLQRYLQDDPHNGLLLADAFDEALSSEVKAQTSIQRKRQSSLLARYLLRNRNGAAGTSSSLHSSPKKRGSGRQSARRDPGCLGRERPRRLLLRRQSSQVTWSVGE